MNQQIYLDNAATTRMAEEVRAEMEPYLCEHYGNASTSYSIGVEAKKAIEKAREIGTYIMNNASNTPRLQCYGV